MLVNRVVSLFVALAMLVPSGLFLPLSLVQAEEAATQNANCPIDGGVVASLMIPQEVLTVEDSLYSQISLNNPSLYTLAGVRVGIAVYDLANTVSHWTTLDGEYLLPPGSTIELPLELSLSSLQKGSYYIKAVAAQGDETALFGAVVKEGSSAEEGARMNKQTNGGDTVSITAEVNGQQFVGDTLSLTKVEPLNVQFVTKNNDDLPLLSSGILTVVAQGTVPLGTAVMADKLDSVKLIPNGTRKTLLENVFVNSGAHTVYAALLTKGTLQPVMTIPVTVVEKTVPTVSYLSVIGTSDFPIKDSSTVVACVDFLGDGLAKDRFVELLGVTFDIKKGHELITTGTVYSSDVVTNDYVSFVPGLPLRDFSLSVKLLQQRFGISYVDNEEYSVVQATKANLAEVDEVVMTYSCSVSGLCDQEEELVQSDIPDAVPTRSFWFYAGIIIAAALLMYLMLRRLPPETTGGIASSKLSDGELQ